MSSAAGQFSPLVEDRDDDAAATIDKGETQKYLSFINLVRCVLDPDRFP
jgi:hypothetical protein